MVKNFIRAIAVIVGVVVAGQPLHSEAAGLVLDNGQLVGATDVNVGTETFSAFFVAGTCADAFGVCDDSQFAFDNLDDAGAGARAIEEAVLIGAFDDDPELVSGCNNLNNCTFTIPFGINVVNGEEVIEFVNLFNISREPGELDEDFFGNGFLLDPLTNFADIGNRVFVRFEPTVQAIPLPATSLLLLSALLGSACAMGFRCKKT